MNLIDTECYRNTEEVGGRTSIQECFPKAVIYDRCTGLGPGKEQGMFRE